MTGNRKQAHFLPFKINGVQNKGRYAGCPLSTRISIISRYIFALVNIRSDVTSKDTKANQTKPPKQKKKKNTINQDVGTTATVLPNSQYQKIILHLPFLFLSDWAYEKKIIMFQPHRRAPLVKIKRPAIIKNGIYGQESLRIERKINYKGTRETDEGEVSH